MASSNNASPGKSAQPWMNLPLPATRALQVYAIDPSAGRYSATEPPCMFPGRSSSRGRPERRSQSSIMTPPTNATIRRSTSIIRCCWQTTVSILRNRIPASTSRWSMRSPAAPFICSRWRWGAISTGAGPIATATRPRTTTPCGRPMIFASSSCIRTRCRRPMPITVRRRTGSCLASSPPTRPTRAVTFPASASSPACRRTSSRTR